MSDYVSYTGDVTTAFDGWVTTVSNGVASQYASYYGGGGDVTAVANAWRDYDQDVSDGWKSFVDNDAAAFQTYGQNTATAAQTAANNIALQNVSRVSNIATELTTYNSLVTPAVKSFKQSVWGAMTPWMTSVAGAEKTATNSSAGAAKTYETSLFAEVHDLSDDFSTAADDFVDHVLGDWLPYAQSVASAVSGAAHGGAGALDTLLTGLRTAGTTQAQDDRTSWTTFKLGLVGTEDTLMTTYAADLKAQSVVADVNNYNTLAATPLADFQFQIGQQTTLMPMGYGVMRPTSDDDYINWGYGIAGTVNPPAPTPPTVDAQQLIRQIEEAAKPRNTVTMPIGASGATLPSRLDDPVNLIWPAGLPRPTSAWQATVSLPPTASQPVNSASSSGWNIGERMAGAAQAMFGAITAAVGGTVAGLGTAATVGAPPAAPVSVPAMAFGSAAAFFGLDQMSAGIGRVLTGHAQRTFTGRALDLSIGDPASAETLAMYASVAAAAGGAALQAIPTVGTTAMALTGQLHHVISNKIAAALARHPTLSGYYQARDPRLVTQAVNRAAHNGYETWHRLLDAEVIEWLSRNQSATPMEFEAWLRWRYSLPDLIWRFPNGF